VGRILSETPLEQLRFSSIEPMDVTQDFVDLVASSERLAPHFHMPLQSGSDRVLRNMHRWYRADHYARRLELIHERLPHAAIGADVIVGFPGEERSGFSSHAGVRGRAAVQLLARLFVFREAGNGRCGFHRACGRRQRSGFERGRCGHWRRRRQRHFAARRRTAGGTLRGLTLHRRGDDWTEALTGNYLKMRIAGHWDANQWVRLR
jgi:threonylcarbamoyladenosine tRNA methylthiotransferase MtaB